MARNATDNGTSTQVAVRLPNELLARVDAFKVTLSTGPRHSWQRPATFADAVRVLIERGLAASETP